MTGTVTTEKFLILKAENPGARHFVGPQVCEECADPARRDLSREVHDQNLKVTTARVLLGGVG
jgi:hypothetical protein